MSNRDPRYFKVYQDGDDRELEERIQLILESGAAPGIDTVAREGVEEIQRMIDNGEIGGGGGGAGVDNVARQEIEGLTEQLADTVKEVNGVKPTNGKVTIPVPEVDTSKLATKTELQAVASGAPKAASRISEMTDVTKNYVYTGNETGYTTGNWYYHNGTSWTSGGVYQNAVGIITDEEFSNSLIGKARIDTLPSDFMNKTSGSVVENGNKAYRDGGTAPKRPDQFYTEFDATKYSVITELNGKSTSQGSQTNGQMGLLLFGFDVIRILEDKYGVNIFQGATKLSDKIKVAKDVISKLTFNWNGYGTVPGGSGAIIGSYNYNTATWDATQNHSNSSVQQLTVVVNDIANRIHPTNGFVYLIAHPSATSDGTTASSVFTDYVKLDVEVPLSLDKRYFSQNEVTTLINNIPYLTDYTNNIIVSGLRLFDSNNLNSSIGEGVAYVYGKKVTKDVTTVTYQANRDTYVDMDGDGNYKLTVVANGAKAPTIPANHLRIGSVVTNGTEVTANRSYNTNFALGFETLTKGGLQQHNTAIGYQALKNNNPDGVVYDNGLYNTALGSWALKENTTGNHNTGVGFEALMWNTTGLQNTGLGEAALFFNTTGNHNTAVGVHVMMKNTTGNYNVAVGNYALEENTTGEKNTAIGNNAGKNTGNHSNSTAIGANSVIDESNAVMLGDQNVTKVKTHGSFEAIDNGDGFICKSPNGTRWKITVADDGSLVTSRA